MTIALSGRRIAGWSGVLAAPLGLANIAAFLVISRGDTAGFLDPAVALGLSASDRTLFALIMLADSLGYYLLPLILGSYLTCRLPAEQAGRAAIAGRCLTLYATLGVVGAVIQLAALPTLTNLAAAGAPGAGAAWAAIAAASQQGLWWFEQLPFAISALLLGPALRATGVGHGRLLTIAGVMTLAYWALAIPGLALPVPGTAAVVELLTFGLLFTFQAWAFLAGLELLRTDRGD